MPKEELLSLVFSFRNEEAVIPELIRRVQATLDELDIDSEIIFVNDDSTDGSLRLLEERRTRDPRIKIISMSRRFGLTPCIIAGYRHAKGDAVIYMDADLQDPPELIPELLEEWRKGAEVVHTTRTVRRGENPLKMLLTKLAYRTINVVADIDIPQNTGDFKLLSRRALNELLKLDEVGPFMRGLVRWVGFKQSTVLYERDPRFAGKTHYSLWRSAAPARAFLQGITSFSSLPLYFALFMGFIVSCGAFVYWAWIMITKLSGAPSPAEGWGRIMACMLFLGGTILFTIGILGIYVGNIHQEIKRRPPFVIADKVGFDDEGPQGQSPGD